MKATLLILACLFSICIANAETITLKQVCAGTGERDWVGSPQNPKCDVGVIKDCLAEITSYSSTSTVTPFTGGGWVLTGTITGIGLSHNNQTYTFDYSQGFTFTQGEYNLTIDGSINYPELIGVTLDMAGVSVNSNGSFSIYIPPIN
ncbi:MAG: hypothetical protein U0Y96_14200 [Candidatus Kapaibacterium sp.]|nr:hypothetical protein [Bacteroidota bacterium]